MLSSIIIQVIAQETMREKHQRSIIKTITWRVLGTLITTSVVYILTRKFVLSLSVGGLDATLKLVFYYLHERAWNEIKWGKMQNS